MRNTILKTVAFFSYILSAFAVFLLFITLGQLLFSQPITTLQYIAQIGIAFLTLTICFKTLVEIDKVLY